MLVAATLFSRDSPANDSSEVIGCGSRILVLPNANDHPACLNQSPVDNEVTLVVSLDLRPPIVGVSARRDEVLRAAMPEAAINENGHARPAEYDVRCSS